jgi:hypothetical protein
LARRRPARRTQHDTVFVPLCWVLAAAGLAGSYWLAPLALQAASCLAGLAGAIAALLLMVVGEHRQG